MRRTHSRARTPMRDNKRPKYTGLTFDEAIGQGKFLLRFLIPAHLGRAIIGKGGETVKAIGHKYNAIISVNDQNTPERSVSITAVPDAAVDCFQEILRLISQPDKKYVEVRLLVHRTHVGLVIGSKGAKIKAMNEAFNTKINIFNEFCPQSTDRIACIKGSEDGIVKTISSLVEDLSKHPIKSHEQNYDVANYDANQVNFYGGFTARNRFDNSSINVDQIRAQQFQQTPGRHNVNMRKASPMPSDNISYGRRRAFSQAPRSPLRRGRSPRRMPGKHDNHPAPSTSFYQEDFLRDQDKDTVQMLYLESSLRGVSIVLGLTIKGTSEQLAVAKMLMKLSANPEPAKKHYSDESLVHNRNFNQARNLIKMKELFIEAFICLIILCIYNLRIDGLVQRLSTQTHGIPQPLAYKRYITKNPHRAKHLSWRQNSAISRVALNDTGILLLTNISIGSPPQHFLVEVDLWVDSELSVLDSNTNLSKVNSAIPLKSTYNSSASSSFFAVNGNYTNWCGDGHLATDSLMVDNLIVNVTFGVIDDLGYWLSYQPVDGTLGLSPKENSNNNISLINQLVDQLDRPIFSFFSNRTASGIGNSLITLGLKTHLIAKPIGALVNGTKVSVPINTTLAILPYSSYISVPSSVKALFINSSNAVHNKEKKLYEVDCDVSKAGNVTFCLGGHDNVIDSTSRSLELSGADYIRYNPRYDLCYLAVYGYKDTSSSYNYIEIPHQFFNNHCIAYNIINKQLGFADTIVPIIDPKNYSP
uniref:Peptidase A1 domain-containing protein n=1 Tax=Ditylenchus dipsaci TaxID=166011 RepID=A0A915D326_9BILA